MWKILAASFPSRRGELFILRDIFGCEGFSSFNSSLNLDVYLNINRKIIANMTKCAPLNPTLASETCYQYLWSSFNASSSKPLKVINHTLGFHFNYSLAFLHHFALRRCVNISLRWSLILFIVIVIEWICVYTHTRNVYLCVSMYPYIFVRLLP